MNILITGGAGFIGSNLAEHFLNDPRVTLVRVLDDLSNGNYENIKELESHVKFEFVKGDICDYETCLQAMNGINRVSHQAALGSVPRSIENPMRTNSVNVGGTVNILHAAKVQGVERIVHAFSSSTYGDSMELPKKEDRIGSPLSPYAVSKYADELYADVFYKTYGLKYIGLRYFNIFGPKQDPDNPYAAVIPLFCKAFLNDTPPVINGNGGNSRDFTYIDNAVYANELALFTEDESALNQIYNVACGDQVSLIDMLNMLKSISGKEIEPVFGPERSGDIAHSKADIGKISSRLGYEPRVRMQEGLAKVYNWYKENQTFG